MLVRLVGKVIRSFVTVDAFMTWCPVEGDESLSLSQLAGGVEASKLPRLTSIVGGVFDAADNGLVIRVDSDLKLGSGFFCSIPEGYAVL